MTVSKALSGDTADIFVIGVGECGSNLVGSYFKNKEQRETTRLREFLILNTDKNDLQKAKEIYNIPGRNALLYGDSEIGVGGKFFEGYEILKNSEDIILNQLKELGYEGVSGFIIFTSLGGGTGCGGTPALVEILRKRFTEQEKRRIFVYVVGVLPFANQTSEAVNSVWAMSTMLRAQLKDGQGPDLLLLLSNKTMLNRILGWERGQASTMLSERLGVDIKDIANIDNLEDASLGKPMEEVFTELVNPLALQTIEAALSPGMIEPGKKVYPTTDLADFSRRLDPIVVPCYMADFPLFPEYKKMEEQFDLMVEYAAKQCSLVDIGESPAAGSVYSIIQGPKAISQSKFSPHLKNALSKYLTKGGSIQPSFVSYEDDNKPSSLLLLFGLPRIPEIKNIISEATDLIKFHDDPKSPIKQGWFKRSKGVNKTELLSALNDLKALFGMT